MVRNPGWVESVPVLGCSQYPELLVSVESCLGQASHHMCRLNLGSLFVTSFTPTLCNRDQTNPMGTWVLLDAPFPVQLEVETPGS